MGALKEGDTIQFEAVGHNHLLALTIEKIHENGHVEFSSEGNTEEMKIERLEYFQKPIALFMITPDYDSSRHIIASLFVKQLYTELAKNASFTKGGRCQREVVFILDEFGNMPAIQDMDTILTVCLGRNIRFNLVIQAYSQLKSKYGEAWETIDGNCNNTIYILTTDERTAERISKKIGEQTITTKSRSGHTLALDKSKTESVAGRRLLDQNELMRLKEGEMVVIRIIKRQDLKRKRIVPYSIFNTKETAMKYRWEYLGEYFDNSRSINEIDIRCLHAEVDLKELIIDFNDKTEGEGSVAAVNLEKKEEEKQEEEQQADEPHMPKWMDMNVQTFFKNDVAMDLLEKHVGNTEKYYEMNISQFMGELDILEQNGDVKPNIYVTLITRYKEIKSQLEENSNPIALIKN